MATIFDVLPALLTGTSLLMMSHIFGRRAERLWLRDPSPARANVYALWQWVLTLALFLSGLFVIGAPAKILLVGFALLGLFLVGLVLRPLAVGAAIPYRIVGLLSLGLGGFYICVSGMVFARALVV